MTRPAKRALLVLGLAAATVAGANLWSAACRHASITTMRRLRSIRDELNMVIASGVRLPELTEGPISRLYAHAALQGRQLPLRDGWGCEFDCITRGGAFVLISLGADHRADRTRTHGAKAGPTEDIACTDYGFWSYPAGVSPGLHTAFDDVPFDALLDFKPEPADSR